MLTQVINKVEVVVVYPKYTRQLLYSVNTTINKCGSKSLVDYVHALIKCILASTALLNCACKSTRTFIRIVYALCAFSLIAIILLFLLQ